MLLPPHEFLPRLPGCVSAVHGGHHQASARLHGSWRVVLVLSKCSYITRRSAVVDGEVCTLTLSQFRGKWVVLFFYPKGAWEIFTNEVCTNLNLLNTLRLNRRLYVRVPHRDHRLLRPGC